MNKRGGQAFRVRVQFLLLFSIFFFDPLFSNWANLFILRLGAILFDTCADWGVFFYLSENKIRSLSKCSTARNPLGMKGEKIGLNILRLAEFSFARNKKKSILAHQQISNLLPKSFRSSSGSSSLLMKRVWLDRNKKRASNS